MRKATRMRLDGTLTKLRGVVEDCLAKHLHSSAVFFADKLVSMSGGDWDDVFLFAQALFVGKHYRRALTVMRRAGFVGGCRGGIGSGGGGFGGRVGGSGDGGGGGGEEGGGGGGGGLRFKHLAAQCLAAVKEWDECLAVLGDGERDEDDEEAERRDEEEEAEGMFEGGDGGGVGGRGRAGGQRGRRRGGGSSVSYGGFAARGGPTGSRLNLGGDDDDNDDVDDDDDEEDVNGGAGGGGGGDINGARSGSVSITSSLSLLRGKVHEALENRPLAQHWYKSALAADPFCYEAFEALISNHMLTAEEERSLLASLRFKPRDEWLLFLYGTMVGSEGQARTW
jgi:anaphase-promoting complex subunit 6